MLLLRPNSARGRLSSAFPATPLCRYAPDRSTCFFQLSLHLLPLHAARRATGSHPITRKPRVLGTPGLAASFQSVSCCFAPNRSKSPNCAHCNELANCRNRLPLPTTRSPGLIPLTI